MAAKIKLLPILAGLAVSVAASCTFSTNFNRGGHPAPDDWLEATEFDSNECRPIDGDYGVLGVGRQTKDEGLIQMRLDVALGHAFPTSKMPTRVSLTVDEQGTLLDYYFGYPIDQHFSLPTNCSGAWYKLEKTITDEYVGDGGVLDYSDRIIELRKTIDGGLIVHTLLKSQFSSIGVIKSRYKREIWSKYEELDSEN